MTRNWQYENDDEGLAGDNCEQWIVRDFDTENRDIVAVIPKTGDEDYDNAVTWPNAQLVAASPDLLSALQDCLQIVQDEYDEDPEHDDLTSWKRAIDAARFAITKATCD